MVPSWAEICSNPVDKSKAAWYKPCNLATPKFEKVMGNNFISNNFNIILNGTKFNV